MNRREFLSNGAKALASLSALNILVSCGTANNKAGGSASGDLSSTSSSTNGHTHTFTITAAELTAAAAISRNDSSVGHAHLVSITSAQIASLAAGGTVSITSGDARGTRHTHTYTLKKA